jgi:hypothetical protein
MVTEIPLINGSGWAVELVSLVVDVLSKNLGRTKREQRDLLRKRLEAKFIQRTKDGWLTKEGSLLKTEAALRKHLDWTWLDQFTIPMCSHLGIVVVTKQSYRLTNYGRSLAERLNDPSFEDALRYVIIRMDEDNWKVLRTLRKSPLEFAALRQGLDQANVRVRKDDHLKKYLHLLATVGLVKEHTRKPVLMYEIDEERYERCKSLLRYKNYQDVPDREFVEHLYVVYKDRTKSGSPFVDIDDLRSAVSRALNWPEYFFTRRLEAIPLQVGRYQLLFSQAAFPRGKIGVERKGRYYNYLSIYLRSK